MLVLDANKDSIERDVITTLILEHMYEERSFNPHLQNVDALDVTTKDDLINWIIKNVKCIYIKNEDSIIVGYACFKRLDDKYIVLSDLYISKKFRRHHYGLRFIDYLKDTYRTSKIVLSVINGNHTGIQFYKKAGFKYKGVKKRTDDKHVTLYEMIYNPKKNGGII